MTVSGIANATTLYTFAYEGTVDDVVLSGSDPDNVLAPLMGETLYVEYTFDKDQQIEDLVDEPDGSYKVPLTAITVTIGSYTFTGAADFEFSRAGGENVTYRVTHTPAFTTTGGTGLIANDFFFNMFFPASDNGTTWQQFYSNDHPTIAPDPAIFASKIDSSMILRIGLTDISGNVAEAQINSFSSIASTAPVPVPAAIWLMGSALIGMIGLNFRNRPANC